MFCTTAVERGFSRAPGYATCGPGACGVRAVFGVSRFRDKVAVIAGAEHPLATSLAQRLAEFGTTVVAIGASEERLQTLARARPERIEPLALRPGRRDVFALLQEAWDEEPVDIFMDLMPLCVTMETTASHAFAQSAGIAAALARGIRNGQARAVVAVPAGGGDSAPEEQARAAGYEALVRRLAAETAPARFLGLRLPVTQDWPVADCLSAGDAMMMLCHPVSRGLAAGSILDWAAEAA